MTSPASSNGRTAPCKHAVGATAENDLGEEAAGSPSRPPGSAFASACLPDIDAVPAATRAAGPSDDATATTPLFKIVLTGGPCAGKTTAMSLIAERLRARGFSVLIVPEVATLLFTGGAALLDPFADSPSRRAFQSTLARTQMALEETFARLARQSHRPSILLCDRGLMDGAAYMAREEWRRMCEENGWHDSMLRDDRYDAVLHLVTAADGKEGYYSCATNATRTESAEEARALDARARDAWVGHPRLFVVDNRTGFAEKMDRVFRLACRLVGLPRAANLDRKFLLGVDTAAGDTVKSVGKVKGVQQFAVEQTFLARERQRDAPGGWRHADAAADEDGDGMEREESVRRRGRDGMYTYTHRVRRRRRERGTDGGGGGGEDVAAELRRNITAREYVALLAHADPSRRTLRVLRHCFLYAGQYFVLDAVENVERRAEHGGALDTPSDRGRHPPNHCQYEQQRPDAAVGDGDGDQIHRDTRDAHGPLLLLRASVEDSGMLLRLPPFVRVLREVTGERAFTMAELSRRVLSERQLFCGRPPSPREKRASAARALGTSL